MDNIVGQSDVEYVDPVSLDFEVGDTLVVTENRIPDVVHLRAMTTTGLVRVERPGRGTEDFGRHEFTSWLDDAESVTVIRGGTDE